MAASHFGPKDVSKDGSTRRLSTACKECHRRRTNCSVGNPCLECTKRGSICLFDEISDKRRKSYESKMKEELGYYQRFLVDLIEAIWDCNDDDVHPIINIVRSGSSSSEIQSEVNNILEGNNPS
ncbi:hypothetical protein N7534_005688 [Penicillium rubens]|nr:hypothetical protein N7534_005688 [Penicillium rubens]